MESRGFMDNRKHMGKDKDGVIFPVAPNLYEMSDSYLDFIEEIKKEIQTQRVAVIHKTSTFHYNSIST